ncbi:MAG: hypothetical protein ACI82F_003536, partial [Planctomycetota bacterium]
RGKARQDPRNRSYPGVGATQHRGLGRVAREVGYVRHEPRLSHMTSRLLPALLSALCVAPSALGQDFGNLGGNGQRNGATEAIGPIRPVVAWSNTADFSLISWMPYIHGEQVLVVRESGFPAAGGSANDEIIAYGLGDGVIQWRTSLPYAGDPNTEFIAWIAGVNSGRVYGARSQNQKPTPIHALDASSGALLWTSNATSEAFAYDGVVFTEDGDLILGDRTRVVRIDGDTGVTEWSTVRSCPVSGACGVAIYGDAVYYDQPEAGGNSLGKLDLATGAPLYDSPLMPGFTDQNTPFVGRDGTVFFARSQNNAAVDFLYAFDDNGTSFTQRWMVPVRWTTGHTHGVSKSGVVYTFNANDEFVGLDPMSGTEIMNAGILSPLGSPNLSPQTVVDGAGTVYVSNGWANTPATDGRLWAFNEDLSVQHFTINLDRQNNGGPALGGAGYLVMADRQGVYAYRSQELGGTYCSPAVPNSAGLSGRIIPRGSLTASDNDVILRAQDLPPNQFGFFINGTAQANVPMAGGSQGTLCVGGSVGRYNLNVAQTGPDGRLELRLDLSHTPTPTGTISINAGQTWHFQCWHRDAGGNSNFTDGVTIVFQ